MQTQETLSGLHRGTPLTLERLRPSLRRRKRRSWTSPFRMKPHSQLLLLGLINVILNLTSVSTQNNVFISWAHSYVDFHSTSSCWVCGAMPLSVMDGLPWWVSPLCQGDFKPPCSFLEWKYGRGLRGCCIKRGREKNFLQKVFLPPRNFGKADIHPSFFSKNLKKGFCNSQIKALEHPMGFFRCYF